MIYKDDVVEKSRKNDMKGKKRRQKIITKSRLEGDEKTTKG